MKIVLKRFIEQSISFYDSLLEYQKEIYEPMLKEPFCANCGEPVERKAWTGKPFKCEPCKRAEVNKKAKEYRDRKKLVLVD